MNILETEWWTVAVPPEWWAESEEDSILIGDRDGVGCIQISTLRKDSGDFTDPEVEEMARAEADAGVEWRRVTLGDFGGLSCNWQEQDSAIREWYLFRGGLLLYVTYSCEVENSGMDDAAVDELLDTLLVLAS